MPLSNMFGYATDLRSSTQGRGQYTMEPHSYAELPKSLRDKIVSERTQDSGVRKKGLIFPAQCYKIYSTDDFVFEKRI